MTTNFTSYLGDVNEISEKIGFVPTIAGKFGGMLDFGAWLKKRREAIGLTQEALATEIGSVVSTVRNYEAADRLPRIGRGRMRDLARGLRMTVPQLEAVGRGEDLDVPILPKEVEPLHGGVLRRHVPPNLLHPTMVPVPVINATAAGHGSNSTDLGYEPGGADRYVLLPPDASADPDAFVVKVEGDSAMPFIRPGDLVVCSPNAKHVPGALYFIQHTSELDEAHRLKLVIPRDNGTAELRSFNPKYPPVTVRAETIAGMAMCLYVVRPMDSILRYAF